MAIIKNVVSLSNLEKGFVDEVISTGAKVFGKEVSSTVALCIQCGCCTGSCPSSRRTALKTRMLFREVIFGFREKVLSSDDLWLCTTCYTCYERCPRGVKATDIVRIIRNIAVREGHLGKKHRIAASYVFKTGHAVPINDEVKDIRKELGMSGLPSTTHSYPEALDSVQKIMKKTGFDQLIGFDLEKMELKEVKL
ncbi:MAG: CoB--CoM heterodisulfide reductase subunit C [Methanosarcinales archaeon]